VVPNLSALEIICSSRRRSAVLLRPCGSPMKMLSVLCAKVEAML
jgi:hypothetical protein